MLYKVVKEKGVVVNDLEFQKDEVFDLDSDVFNVPELLAEGSIVEETELLSDEGASSTEDIGDEPEAVKEEVLSFNGKKVVGEVTEVETNEVLYKTFSTEDGQTFKVPVKEFEESVVRE